MARRGRRANLAAKRRQTTRAGQGRIDPGTPELLRHREKAHGMRHIGTDHPIDILAAQGLLAPRADGETERDWRIRNTVLRDSAVRFAQLHRQLFGGGPRAVDPNAVRGSSIDRSMPDVERPIDRLAAARYRQSRDALLAASRRVLDAVSNAAIYLRPLPDSATRPAQHKTELTALRRGLAILADLPPVRVEQAEPRERVDA